MGDRRGGASAPPPSAGDGGRGQAGGEEGVAMNRRQGALVSVIAVLLITAWAVIDRRRQDSDIEDLRRRVALLSESPGPTADGPSDRPSAPPGPLPTVAVPAPRASAREPEVPASTNAPQPHVTAAMARDALE